MKSRKPKAKTKQKAKRNPKQQPLPAAEQVQAVPIPEANTESVSAVAEQVETENPASIVETPTEIERSSSPTELRDQAADSESTVEVPHERKEPATAGEAVAEMENFAAPMQLPHQAEEAAGTVELREQPEQTEDLECIIQLHVEVESAMSDAELHDVTDNATAAATANSTSNATTNAPSPAPNYDASDIPVIPVDTPPVPEMPSPRSAPRNAADRRAHPRYAFVAAIEVVAPELDARIKTQVRDISQQGCYVDTDKPLALGTTTEVRISKGATAFEARARVVFNQAAKGMGLMFTTVDLEHLKTLDIWIAESRESSWRAANRRRSQRVYMKVPVRISGQAADGATFEEETHTLSISPHGALLVLAPAVQRGQRFILANLQTKAALECVVAHLERLPGEPTQVGVEFSLPNPAFWRVAFPPKDWTPRHPDAKSR
jgi:hypothetical protein